MDTLHGGAIALLPGSTMNIKNGACLTFSNNCASFDGALVLESSTSKIMQNSRLDFFNNSASYSGAVHMEKNLILPNCQ